MRRRELLGLAAALAGARVLTRVLPSHAQTLAGKQIRVVVPFPAGGPTDIVARPFSQMLGEALKATIVVDNRGGAGGSIGADVIAKSEPDGQSLLVGTVGTHAINSALYAKLPYDAVKDFTPLALIALAPVAIVVHPSLLAKNLADLVALAKKNPGKLNYGSAGVGTPGHLTAEMFRAASGIDIQHVPYKGQRARRHRSDRRPDPDHVRSPAIGAVERAGRQDPRARGVQQGALAGRARRADHRRVRL